MRAAGTPGDPASVSALAMELARAAEDVLAAGAAAEVAGALSELSGVLQSNGTELRRAAGAGDAAAELAARAAGPLAVLTGALGKAPGPGHSLPSSR